MTGHEPKASVRWLTAAGWASLVVFAATSTIVATSLKQIGADLDLSLALRGSLAPARSTMLGISAFAIGYLADRLGKRRLLGASMFVVAFALLCLGRVGTYAGLVAATVALGAGLGGLEALASPLIADLHPDDVELHMPLLHAFFPLGIVASSLLAGWGLDAGMPWQALFGVTSIPAALVGAMFLFGRYGTESHEGPKRVALSVPAVLGNVTFWLLGAAMALTAGVEGALTLWTPSFVQDEYGASALVAASGLTCFSAAMAVGRLGAGFATRRVPLHKMMVALSVACALVTVALVLFRNVSVSFVAFGLSGLFIACFWPGILSVATRRIAAGSATLLAMLSVAGIVGYGGLPWSVGALADRFGLRLALGILPVSMGAAALALFAAGRTSAPDNGYARRVAPE